MIYMCPVCGKEFRRRVLLKLHRSSHTKFKYKCQVCGKVFSLRYQVLQHQRLHGVAKLRHCKTYPEVYRHLSGLMKNSPAHFSGWPFKCKKCPSSFLKSPYLFAHMFRVHGVVTDSRPATLKSTKLKMADPEINTCQSGDQILVPVRNQSHDDQNAPTLCAVSSLSSSVQCHGLSNTFSGQRHAPADPSSGQCRGPSDTSSDRSPRSRPLLESPRRSPGQLARQRLLKKYQRFQSSYPVCRSLCVDKNPYAHRSLIGKITNTSEDLPMPKLRVVLKDVGLNTNNGVKVLKVQENGTTPPKKAGASVSCNGSEEELCLHLSDSSDMEEDSMPHLHRVSSEEKACDSDDWQSDAEDQRDKPSMSLKTDGFKEREGLFEVLQHEHRRSGRKNTDYLMTSEETLDKKHKPNTHKQGLNGLVPLKSQRQSSVKSAHEKLKSPNHRTGIFSMPDLMMVSEWSRVDKNESLENRSMPKLHGTNNSSSSKAEQRTIPKLTLKKLPKYLVSSSSQVKGNDSSTCVSQQSESNDLDSKVTSADFLHSSCSQTLSALSSLERIHHCDRKCAPPCCARPESPHLPVSGASRSSEHVQARTKRHHRDASSLMTDLSELKHDREDQAEVYPDSLSSMEDLWEGSGQTQTCSSSSSLLERRLSCPSKISTEDVPVKRRRHMTISGKVDDPRKPCPAARERRRRPKPLSHRCMCCMDQGSGRKRKKRKYRRKEKTLGWEIPEVLSDEQADFIHNVMLLLSLRHKVYRLCQVLFPKLASVWQLNPDTEQIDLLVMEITDVTRTVSSKHEMDTSAPRKTCRESDEIKMNSGSHDQTVDKLERTWCNVGELSCDIQENNGTKVNKTRTNTDETSGNTYSESRSNSPDMNKPCPPLWKEEEHILDVCKGNVNTILDTSGGIKGFGGPEPTHPNLTPHSELLIPNLKCCNVKGLISPTCEGETEDGLPLLECYSGQLDSSEGRGPVIDLDAVGSTENPWGMNVLETIEEEPLAVDGSQCKPDSTCESFSANPDSARRGTECSLWGNTANKSWESEFMKYLRGNSVAPVGKPEGSAKINPDKTGDQVTCIQTQSASHALDTPMSNIHVTLCKNPYLCLTRLRKKVILLLKPLLPNLTFENNFDKFSDDVDMLVELVIQSNETKEARSASTETE